MSGRGRGRGEARGGGGGRYTQTQTQSPRDGSRGGGYRGAPRGRPQSFGGGGGQQGGRFIDDHPITGRVLATNWNGRLPPAGRGVAIEIFGSGNPAPPDALVRQMEDEPKLGGELDSMFSKMTLDGKNTFPVRPGYNTEGTEIKVYANYFPVKVDPIEIHKYNIAFVGAQPPQAKKGQLIRLLVEGRELALTPNKIPYRTNFRDIICTTKAIKYKGMTREGTSEKVDIEYIPEWEDLDVAGDLAHQRERQRYTAQITWGFSIDLEDLMKRLDPREARPLPERVESIIQALNAMFNHNPYANENAVAVVAKTGMNKYFDKRRLPNAATFTELSDGLEAIRGFIKSVRLGTGRILLNVNVATGVFVQPVSLRYFYKQTLGSYQSLADKEKRLKLLRVGRIHLKKTKGGRTIYPPATILGFAKKFDGQQNKNSDKKLEPGSSEQKKKGEKCEPPRFAPNFKWPGAPGPKQVQFFMTPRDPPNDPGRWITVFDYFKENYPEFKLDDTLPVVNIGSTAFPSYIPLEAAIILAGNQSKGKLDRGQTKILVDFACRKPKQNAMAITEGGREILGLDKPASDGMLKLGITVDENMITVAARVLNPPAVVYQRNKQAHTITPNGGSWNLINVQFAEPKPMMNWAYVFVRRGGVQAPDAQQAAKHIEGFVNSFISFMKNLGMPIAARVPTTSIFCSPDGAALDMMLKSIKANNRIQWLLVILERNDTQLYNAIKKAGDVKWGVKTVCVTAEKFTKGTPQEPNGQYFGNVALKFNLKAGGINNTLGGIAPLQFISDDKTMILGLDVTHPSPGSAQTAASVAAMVASVDGKLGQWPGIISVQKAGAPGSAREMVDELTSMLESRLRLWAAGHKGQLPENIILYRDGVSEGQYDLCLELELPRLKEATRHKDFRSQYGKRPPRWTIVICSKRHHTRFFPAAEGDKSTSKTSNCVAGTTVDRDITTPQYWEFFLQAHHCIQGTAKPCRYIVIKDEIFTDKTVIGIAKGKPMSTASMLPTITNNMCHMFGRATKAVSLCPPAYYADILCERARVYLSHEFIANDMVMPPNPNDYVKRDGKVMTWIRDFKPEEWEGPGALLNKAQRAHYLEKARVLRERQQRHCNLHADVKDSMFYV